VVLAQGGLPQNLHEDIDGHRRVVVVRGLAQAR
jgi:hypothetical protein